MDILHLTPAILAALIALALAFACLPERPRDPDEVERGRTTILPEDR